MHGYCFTINNYTPEHVLRVQGSIGQAGIKYVCYGFEVGEQGTPHMQAYLQATHDHKARFQKAFGVKCHLEKQNGATGPSDLELQGTFGKPYTAVGYCMKDGDFHQFGDKTDIKGTTKGARTDLNEVKEAIERGESYDDICETHFKEAAMYGRFIKERIAAKQSADGKKILLGDYKDVSWKPWQQAVLDAVEQTPDRRKIQWIWESTGKVGKSWLATYLALTKNAIILETGKQTDLIHVFSKRVTNIVIVDLVRTNETTEADRKHFLDGMYSLAEKLKNGRMLTLKYDGTELYFPIPHVIFFANFEPDYTKWSADRYDVTNLNELSFAPP